METPELTLPIRRDLIGEDAITQGRFWMRKFVLAFADGTLWDTSPYTARMQIRASYDGPVIVELTDANLALQVFIRDSAPNQYNFAMILRSATTAPLIDWGLGVYDVEFADPGGVEKIAVYTGLCTMSRRVTR